MSSLLLRIIFRSSVSTKITSPSVVLLSKAQASTVSEATFTVKDFKLHQLNTGPSTSVTVTREDAVKYFRQMQTIREMETAAASLYNEKIIRGFCPLSSGQEAVCIGIEAALRKSDHVITGFRPHGWAYTRGLHPSKILCELTGRSSGCSKGKGGSMHLYCANFHGGHGIVGTPAPLGAGIALAQKYNKTDNICISLYGDGAANQGQVFEAFNMSKLWNLPVIYVCENNGYGMATSNERSSANTDYYTRGHFIPGIRLDGMDVLAVREVTRFATEYCRSGKGPILLEMITYRYSGDTVNHSRTSFYRTQEEIQLSQLLDPITSFKNHLLITHLVTAEEIQEIEQEVCKEIAAAVVAAKSDKEPNSEELYTEIYCDENYIVRGCTPLVWATAPKRSAKAAI